MSDDHTLLPSTPTCNPHHNTVLQTLGHPPFLTKLLARRYQHRSYTKMTLHLHFATSTPRCWTHTHTKTHMYQIKHKQTHTLIIKCPHKRIPHTIQAPVHFLVIPKVRDGLTELSRAEERHEAVLGHLLFVAQKVAKQGCELLVGCGWRGGRWCLHPLTVLVLLLCPRGVHAIGCFILFHCS